jgi:hypothetical protein
MNIMNIMNIMNDKPRNFKVLRWIPSKPWPRHRRPSYSTLEFSQRPAPSAGAKQQGKRIDPTDFPSGVSTNPIQTLFSVNKMYQNVLDFQGINTRQVAEVVARLSGHELVRQPISRQFYTSVVEYGRYHALYSSLNMALSPSETTKAIQMVNIARRRPYSDLVGRS